MKRKIENLTYSHIRRIRIWLSLSSKEAEHRCPFSLFIDRCFICQDIFPSLALGKNCPCRQFPRKYVRKVAKKVVKNWYKMREFQKNK